jgi:hypothetical protein
VLKNSIVFLDVVSYAISVYNLTSAVLVIVMKVNEGTPTPLFFSLILNQFVQIG